MQLITGKQKGAQKVVIYGPEGIGKSTFSAKFPAPVFIDTEGSTRHMDVARTPKPSSWAMLLEQVKYFISNPGLLKTLIIDTADWAEQLCIESILAKYQKTGIEDFGYGKGYVYLGEEFVKLLNLLEELVALGVNVVITAHAKMRKFEQPDETGAYDRWEMKLGKHTAPLVKEWSDMVLFASYETFVVKTDDKKNKAQGGSRVIYTTHHPCWDAKNRHSLPEKIRLDYAEIAHCITDDTPQNIPVAQPENPETQAKQSGITEEKDGQTGIPQELRDFNIEDFEILLELPELPENIPKQLADLMIANCVKPEHIQAVIAQKGYFPPDTPLEKLPLEFVNGVLIAAWDQVFEAIKKLNIKDDKVPF